MGEKYTVIPLGDNQGHAQMLFQRWSKNNRQQQWYHGKTEFIHQIPDNTEDQHNSRIKEGISERIRADDAKYGDDRQKNS